MNLTPDEQMELFAIVEELAAMCSACRWTKHAPHCKNCRCRKARNLVEQISKRQKHGADGRG